jgi:hypothetical protein
MSIYASIIFNLLLKIMIERIFSNYRNVWHSTSVVISTVCCLALGVYHYGLVEGLSLTYFLFVLIL